MILSKMKGMAENYLGSRVKDAIITVPAYFNDSQRQSTRNAGLMAGLKEIRLLDDPIAAALAYELDQTITNLYRYKKNVLVFDLGLETFDVSLVCMKKNKWVLKATSGDTHPVGADFNSSIVNYFAEEFKRNHKVDISESPRALGRLRAACENAIKSLSLSYETNIELNCLHNGIDFSSTLVRSKFETLNKDLFKKCIGYVDECLRRAKMERSDVDEVVLVGESTRIPKIQQLLQDFFDGKELCKSINPDEVVARGAAIYGTLLPGRLHVFVDPLIPSQLEVNKLENLNALQEAMNDLEMLKKQIEEGKKQVEKAQKDVEATKKETRAKINEVDQKIAFNNNVWEQKFAELQKAYETSTSSYKQKDVEATKKETEAIRNEIDQKIASNNHYWEQKFMELQKAYDKSGCDVEAAKKETEANRNEIDQKIASNNRYWQQKFVELQKTYETSSSNKGFICICDQGRIQESIPWPKFSDYRNV